MKKDITEKIIKVLEILEIPYYKWMSSKTICNNPSESDYDVKEYTDIIIPLDFQNKSKSFESEKILLSLANETFEDYPFFEIQNSINAENSKEEIDEDFDKIFTDFPKFENSEFEKFFTPKFLKELLILNYDGIIKFAKILGIKEIPIDWITLKNLYETEIQIEERILEKILEFLKT